MRQTDPFVPTRIIYNNFVFLPQVQIETNLNISVGNNRFNGSREAIEACAFRINETLQSAASAHTAVNIRNATVIPQKDACASVTLNPQHMVFLGHEWVCHRPKLYDSRHWECVNHIIPG